MEVVLVYGDGIGKEICNSVVDVAKALACDINWENYQAGAQYYEETGNLLEDGLLEAIENKKIVLKGPTATPIGTGFRSINVQLRQIFNTYVNLRPIKSIEGIESRYENVDIVIFRENSEDLYKGVEYMYSSEIAHGIKIISKAASEKIFIKAFEYAKKQNRKKVTCVHKANIMKLTDGLFLDTFREVAKNYPEIEANDLIIDACCMKLVTDPQQFDVIVTENLYGDILSDLCAGLVGGLGFAPSANIGDEVTIYEAVHGSAPDIAGQNKANPTAILLAFSMLLKDNGMIAKAELLENAIFSVIKEGKVTTSDIGGSASTTEFTDAIIERINK